MVGAPITRTFIMEHLATSRLSSGPGPGIKSGISVRELNFHFGRKKNQERKHRRGINGRTFFQQSSKARNKATTKKAGLILFPRLACCRLFCFQFYIPLSCPSVIHPSTEASILIDSQFSVFPYRLTSQVVFARASFQWAFSTYGEKESE